MCGHQTQNTHAHTEATHTLHAPSVRGIKTVFAINTHTHTYTQTHTHIHTHQNKKHAPHINHTLIIHVSHTPEGKGSRDIVCCHHSHQHTHTHTPLTKHAHTHTQQHTCHTHLRARVVEIMFAVNTHTHTHIHTTHKTRACKHTTTHMSHTPACKGRRDVVCCRQAKQNADSVSETCLSHTKTSRHT